MQLASAEGWRETVDRACAAVARAGGKPPSEKEDPGGHVSWSKAGSFYGRDANFSDAAVLMERAEHAGLGTTTFLIWQVLMERAEHAGLGTTRTVEAASMAELAAATRPYVDSSDDAAQGALWPLVERVTLRGPWAVCAAGVRLCDTAGLHDDNAARNGVMAGVVAEADALLVVSNIRRACNDKVPSAGTLYP